MSKIITKISHGKFSYLLRQDPPLYDFLAWTYHPVVSLWLCSLQDCLNALFYNNKELGFVVVAVVGPPLTTTRFVATQFDGAHSPFPHTETSAWLYESLHLL